MKMKLASLSTSHSSENSGRWCVRQGGAALTYCSSQASFSAQHYLYKGYIVSNREGHKFAVYLSSSMVFCCCSMCFNEQPSWFVGQRLVAKHSWWTLIGKPFQTIKNVVSCSEYKILQGVHSSLRRRFFPVLQCFMNLRPLLRALPQMPCSHVKTVLQVRYQLICVLADIKLISIDVSWRMLGSDSFMGTIPETKHHWGHGYESPTLLKRDLSNDKPVSAPAPGFRWPSKIRISRQTQNEDQLQQSHEVTVKTLSFQSSSHAKLAIFGPWSHFYCRIEVSASTYSITKEWTSGINLPCQFSNRFTIRTVCTNVELPIVCKYKFCLAEYDFVELCSVCCISSEFSISSRVFRSTQYWVKSEWVARECLQISRKRHCNRYVSVP